jgi:hypothetical protein
MGSAPPRTVLELTTGGSMSASTSWTPDHCQLRHPVFATFRNPLFRGAEGDNAPVMVIELGDKDATLLLTAMQREFGISAESNDGVMLRLITQSLDFVSCLRIGDPLPAEILTGQASWQPEATYLRISNARLQWQLVNWLNDGGAADEASLAPQSLLQLADDPARRQLVQQAFAKAADVLGLPDGEAVVAQMEELGRELAYIEALRERLLRRVKAMVRKLDRIAQSFRGDGSRQETITRVRHLAAAALTQIGHRFDELDAQTGEVMAALRNTEGQQAFIRSNRDWLYVSQRAWQPLLVEWDAVSTSMNDEMVLQLNRTYRFLAPRFMPVTDWIAASRPTRVTDTTEPMKW